MEPTKKVPNFNQVQFFTPCWIKYKYLDKDIGRFSRDCFPFGIKLPHMEKRWKSQTPIPTAYQALHECFQNCHLNSNNFIFSGPESFWDAISTLKKTAKKKLRTKTSRDHACAWPSGSLPSFWQGSLLHACAFSPNAPWVQGFLSLPTPGKIIRIAQHQLIFTSQSSWTNPKIALFNLFWQISGILY